MIEIKNVDILTEFANKGKNEYQLSEVFHENTKINEANEFSWVYHIAELFNNNVFLEATPHSYKTYTGTHKIFLPSHSELQPIDLTLQEVIKSRRTCRNFSSKEYITLNQLSFILLNSYGITGEITDENNDIKQELRATPSAGGLYPIEIYLTLNNVQGIENGLYHYNGKLHALEFLQKGDYKQEINKINPNTDSLQQCQCVIFLTAIFPRSLFKYGNRGYRFVHLDAGHIAQNLTLTSTASGLGNFPCGGYYDDEVNKLLQIDGVTESVVYEMGIGIPS